MCAGMENKITELEQEKKSKHAEIKMLQSSKDAEMGGEVKVCVCVCLCVCVCVPFQRVARCTWATRGLRKMDG